jgi:hypothetical protein
MTSSNLDATSEHMPPGHHPFDATAGLSAVNALRVTSAPYEMCALAVASTPRPAGPSGIDGASAQRRRWRSRDGRLITAVDTLVSARDTHACLAGHRWSRRPTALNPADLHGQDAWTGRGQECLSPQRLL